MKVNTRSSLIQCCSRTDYVAEKLQHNDNWFRGCKRHHAAVVSKDVAVASPENQNASINTRFPFRRRFSTAEHTSIIIIIWFSTIHTSAAYPYNTSTYILVISARSIRDVVPIYTHTYTYECSFTHPFYVTPN